MGASRCWRVSLVEGTKRASNNTHPRGTPIRVPRSVVLLRQYQVIKRGTNQDQGGAGYAGRDIKELQRKNEALAEAAAHLFLTKKVSRILGGEK